MDPGSQGISPSRAPESFVMVDKGIKLPRL